MTKDQNRFASGLLVDVRLALAAVDVRPKASCSQRILMAPYLPAMGLPKRSASMKNSMTSSVASQKGFSELLDG